MDSLQRGIVKVKPIYIGIHHYRDVYGSVCSEDVVGTPKICPPEMEELRKAAQEMIDRFKEKSSKVDFVEIEQPLIVKEHKDLRKLPLELNYDTDALLVGTLGDVHTLENYALSRYGLPLIYRDVTVDFLKALRVKKFLRESKFLYIGEFPSFSVPIFPRGFLDLEKRLGVRIRQIETNEFYRWFDRFPEEEVKRELDNWKNKFDKINCGRFTEERPVVPCLAFARLIDEGIMCACEGDITAMLSSLMLHAVSGQSVLMGNFGSSPGHFEAKEGEVTIEHDIIPLSMVKTGYTVRDYHGRKFGVTGYADIKDNQPMTILNVDRSLDKISVIEGTIKGSEDGIHCRVIVRMNVDGDVKRVPEIIVGSQHVSMTFGHHLSALKEVGNLLGFEVRHL